MRKREEENKRKEAEQQKGQLSPDFHRPQALPCLLSPHDEPSRQSRDPRKQPLAGHKAQGPEPRDNQRSPGNRPQQEQKVSSDPQGIDSRKPKETCREHTRGHSACVHIRPSEGTGGDWCPRISSVEKPGGEATGEHRCAKGKGMLKEPSSIQRARTDGKGADPGHEAASLPPQDGGGKPARRHNSTPKARSGPQKRHSQGLRGRCSPAGSSRPGSARGEVVPAGQTSLPYRTPRNKVTQVMLPGGESPESTEEMRSGARKSGLSPLTENTQISKETHPTPSLAGQGVNIDLLPVELRLQIIHRERSRKELFRKKNEAATVIQRAWRSSQLRKHLFHLLHRKQLGARDTDRWERECMALVLQVWRKELALKLPKNIAVRRTPRSPSKGISGTKATKHSVLKQIYGCSQEGKKVCHATRPSRPPAVPRLNSVSNLQFTHLLENTARSKNFSYNLQSAIQSKNKPKL